MERRELLRTAGIVVASGAAGCLGSGAVAGPGGNGTPNGKISEKHFEVTSVTPGSATQSASVSFGSPLTVTGTTTGNDGCYTAVLESVTYDHPELELVVRAKQRDGKDMCTQSLVTIDYEATVSFTGDGPERVVVKHDSMGETRKVASVRRDGG